MMQKYSSSQRVAEPSFLGLFVRTFDIVRLRNLAVRYTKVRGVETCLPITKALFRALLSQLHPGHSTELCSNERGWKDLQRGPEYQIVTDPERERGTGGLIGDSLSRNAASL